MSKTEATKDKAAEFQRSQEEWRTALGFVRTDNGRPLAGRVVMVALSLQKHENREIRLAYPSRVTVGVMAGVTGNDKTVADETGKAIRILESVGLIERAGQFYNGATKYRFTIPESAAESIPRAKKRLEDAKAERANESESEYGIHDPDSPETPESEYGLHDPYGDTGDITRTAYGLHDPYGVRETSPVLTSEGTSEGTSEINLRDDGATGDGAETVTVADAAEDLDDGYFEFLEQRAREIDAEPEPESVPFPAPEQTETETETETVAPEPVQTPKPESALPEELAAKVSQILEGHTWTWRGTKVAWSLRQGHTQGVEDYLKILQRTGEDVTPLREALALVQAETANA